MPILASTEQAKWRQVTQAERKCPPQTQQRRVQRGTSCVGCVECGVVFEEDATVKCGVSLSVRVCGV